MTVTCSETTKSSPISLTTLAHSDVYQSKFTLKCELLNLC